MTMTYVLFLMLDKRNAQASQVVDYLVRDRGFSDQLHHHIRGIGDMERLISKVAVGRINPRELQQLKRSLGEVEEIKQLCCTVSDASLQRTGEQLNSCRSIYERIDREISEDPPV